MVLRMEQLRGLQMAPQMGYPTVPRMALLRELQTGPRMGQLMDLSTAMSMEQ